MTTITDDFNRADGDIGSSSEGWSWTQVRGDLNIASNVVQPISASHNEGRAEFDLQTDNMFAQATVPSGTFFDLAVAVRWDSTASTYYSVAMRENQNDIVVNFMNAGVNVPLTSVAVPNVAAGDTIRVEVFDDLISAIYNGVKVASFTDRRISRGNRRAGFNMFNSNGRVENFSAGDLLASPTYIVDVGRALDARY